MATGKSLSEIEVSTRLSSDILPTGRENTVKTAKGTQVSTSFAVVEADRLITSWHKNAPIGEFKTAAASLKEAEPHSSPRGAIYNPMLSLRKAQDQKRCCVTLFRCVLM